MPTHKLEFDASRPFGPLKNDETCTIGLKKASFDAKSSTGYTHGIQLTRLEPRSDLHHVFSLKITGLMADHGMNAVAIVMDRVDGCDYHNNMFRKEKKSWPEPYCLWIYSQFTCPWENTLLTLVVSPSDSNVEAYVEQCTSDADESMKRTRDEDAMPFVATEDERRRWTDIGNGIKHRSFEASFTHNKIPNIGVLMSGGLDNAVEIVPASLRIVQIMNDTHAPDSLVTYG